MQRSRRRRATAQVADAMSPAILSLEVELDPKYDLAIDYAWRIMLGNVTAYLLKRY